MSQRIASKHKYTVHCPIEGCKYTSRHWVFNSTFKISHKESVFSTKCPKHQTILIKLENT